MKNRFLFIVIFLMGFTVFSYGQSTKKPTFKKVTNTTKTRKSNKLYQPIQISSNTPKKRGPYYLNKQVILEKLNVNIIPLDYPKYDAKLSKADNINLIDKWMLKNKHLIKDKYKAQYK